MLLYVELSCIRNRTRIGEVKSSHSSCTEFSYHCFTANIRRVRQLSECLVSQTSVELHCKPRRLRVRADDEKESVTVKKLMLHYVELSRIRNRTVEDVLMASLQSSIGLKRIAGLRN